MLLRLTWENKNPHWSSEFTLDTKKLLHRLILNKSESVYFWHIVRWSQKTILSSCHQGFKPLISQKPQWCMNNNNKRTFCTLMEGNMFWNMVAMSFMCMPSEPKLLRMSRGWCVNCWSCIRCFFRDETTSLTREYWGKIKLRVTWRNKTKKVNVRNSQQFWAHQCVYFEKTSLYSQLLKRHHLSPSVYCVVSVFIHSVYLQHFEMKRGAFGKSCKSLKDKEMFVSRRTSCMVVPLWQIQQLLICTVKISHHVHTGGCFAEDHEVSHSQWSSDGYKVFEDVLFPDLNKKQTVQTWDKMLLSAKNRNTMKFRLVGHCSHRLTFRASAVYGSITLRTSRMSCPTFFPIWPRWKTKECGTAP